MSNAGCPLRVHNASRLCPHQESNLDRSLRRAVFYPLNYEGACGNSGRFPVTVAYTDDTPSVSWFFLSPGLSR